MKKILRGVLVAFVALVVLVGGIFIYSTVDSRTLENTIKGYDIQIFIPSSMANEYNDLLAMTFDDHRIWKYELNAEEIAQLTGNLKNGLWQKLSGNAVKELEWYLPDSYKALGEDVYFCAYRAYLNEFDDIGTTTHPQFLFLYDIENHIYYCVSKSI